MRKDETVYFPCEPGLIMMKCSELPRASCCLAKGYSFFLSVRGRSKEVFYPTRFGYQGVIYQFLVDEHSMLPDYNAIKYICDHILKKEFGL